MITVAVFSGYNFFNIFLILITVSISLSELSLSKCVTTTIKGKLNIFANYIQLVFCVSLTPETTHNAYYGKNEHKLDTTCFYLWPPTSMNDNILLEFYNHDYMGISVLFVKIFPFASNAITWWLFVWVMPDMNSSLWVNTFVREEPLPLSFYPLLITPSNVLFPEPGSPINSSLISNLTPCCGSLVTMSSTMFPLSPSAAITTVTLACILLASVHIVFNDSYIYYLSKPVGLPSSSTPMR